MKRLGLAAALTVCALTVATAVAGETPWAQDETVLIATPPRAIADFTLTDQQGRDFKLSSLRGQRVLVFFGFTHCPDICPATLLKLRQLKQAAPQELADVRVVMISVDGDRDSPRLLKEYLSAFWPDFIGLTGTPAAVRDIAARFPAVFIKGIPPAPGGDYSVQHSSLVYVLDEAGQLRAEFSDSQVDAMASYLRTLTASQK